MFYNKYLRVIYNKLNLQNHLKPRTRTCMKKINIRLIIYIAINFFSRYQELGEICMVGIVHSLSEKCTAVYKKH